MAERQFGPYRLVRQIAVGGMAEIHLAKTKGIAGFEKYVALKMIHPNFAEDEQFIQMLVDEAKIAVQLNHGNIAQTFDLGRVGDTFYITMEYVDGADLYKVLRKGSEIDNFEMPLDVCAFIAKEVASALDHAHRKRDHTGKTLGIVHRDVSPQNVLVSFAGEVKLVDFGIAKATMKARQTAVGVIKGKYYYMSPEQAWGDQLDYRSDIFSAGIVLYEMITGQMLYLEEDLQRLLEMARNADIAPPSTLRKGIPPQLEKIVMHALAKDRRDRYQSASDMAADLERFLHAYSPVFTAAKVAAMIKQVIGGPMELPAEEVEVRDGPMSTHTLSSEDLILDKEELKDENSVIFRVADLKPKQPVGGTDPKRAKQASGGFAAGPRVTRQADLSDLSGAKPMPKAPASKPAPAARPAPAASKPGAIPSMPRPAKSRDRDEVTREVGPAPPGGAEDGGLTGDLGELENINESTMMSAPPSFGGFLMENAGEDGVDATIVSSGPPRADDTDENIDPSTSEIDPGGIAEGDVDDEVAEGDEDGPTIQRDFRDQAKPKARSKRSSAPPALAAKIHAPAVSEIRKPRASRKTPQGGVPAQGNVLQALVGGRPAEAMPAPRPAPGKPQRTEDSGALTLPGDSMKPVVPASPAYPPPMQVGAQTLGPSVGAVPSLAQPPKQQPQPQQPQPQQQAPQQPPQPYYQQPYGQGAPAQGQPQAPYPGYPPQPQAYPGYPPPQQPQQPYGYSQPPVSPGALYQLQPYGAPPPQPMSITGQLRLFEADEIGDKYKVSGSGTKFVKLAIAGVLAISVAAGVSFMIVKSTQDKAPRVGTVRVESVPPGAEVTFDGTRIAGATPLTIEGVPVGTRHEVKVAVAKHKTYTETVDIPRIGGEVPVKALMEPITGKLLVDTQPGGVDIYIDGRFAGRSPTTLSGIDMASARILELRLKDYSPIRRELDWPANGEIRITEKLVK